MRTFLAIIFIVSATIKAGNCVVCIECSNNATSDCAGDLVTCGTCMTLVTEKTSNDGNSISYSVQKMCNLDSSVCNVTYGVSREQSQARYTVNCCDTDFCNKKALEVTSWNNTENGLECPTCYAEDAENCTANSTVQCTGEEIKCLAFSGKVLREGICQTVTFQGCASELACDHFGYLFPVSEQCQNSTMSCSNGKNATYVL